MVSTLVDHSVSLLVVRMAALMATSTVVQSDAQRAVSLAA